MQSAQPPGRPVLGPDPVRTRRLLHNSAAVPLCGKGAMRLPSQLLPSFCLSLGPGSHNIFCFLSSAAGIAVCTPPRAHCRLRGPQDSHPTPAELWLQVPTSGKTKTAGRAKMEKEIRTRSLISSHVSPAPGVGSARQIQPPGPHGGRKRSGSAVTCRQYCQAI